MADLMLWENLFQTEAAVTTKAWSPIEERRVAGMCPQFSAHVCCGQNDGWIKMPLGTEVGLGPGHVLDGDPSTPTERGHSSPFFSVHVYYSQTVAHLSNC